MSIALKSSNGNRVDRPGLLRGVTCGSVYESPVPGRPVFEVDRGLELDNTDDEIGVADVEVDSSSSSSIGANSDSSGGESDGDADSGEVQSSYKSPLDALDALEEVLPMKRSISKFYSGKSKSFTSLGDAVSCSSVKEIVKPENAYTRRNRNLLAHSTYFEKNGTGPRRASCGGISKRAAIGNKSTLALGMTMNSYDNNSDSSNSSSSPPTLFRPPLYPQSKKSLNNEAASSSSPRPTLSSWRSFSLSDLQGAAATPPGLLINQGDKNKLQ